MEGLLEVEASGVSVALLGVCAGEAVEVHGIGGIAGDGGFVQGAGLVDMAGETEHCGELVGGDAAECEWVGSGVDEFEGGLVGGGSTGVLMVIELDGSVGEGAAEGWRCLGLEGEGLEDVPDALHGNDHDLDGQRDGEGEVGAEVTQGDEGADGGGAAVFGDHEDESDVDAGGGLQLDTVHGSVDRLGAFGIEGLVAAG